MLALVFRKAELSEQRLAYRTDFVTMRSELEMLQKHEMASLRLEVQRLQEQMKTVRLLLIGF